MLIVDVLLLADIRADMANNSVLIACMQYAYVFRHSFEFDSGLFQVFSSLIIYTAPQIDCT